MAIRKIARMGHPVLRKKAKILSTKEIRSDKTAELVKDMIETMEEYGGIGIAAPQIHEPLSIAIIDFQEDQARYPDAKKGEKKEAKPLPLTVIINPVITPLDLEEQGYWEGCLSVPEIRGFVYRPRKVQIDYLDLDAKKKKIIAEGFLATVFQHELDHLFGVLFVDRIRYEPGKSPIAFMDEYQRFLAPKKPEKMAEKTEEDFE